ncbi:MAG: putative aldouronate transport system permease protein [Clostridiales bacterium]|nr:putative aldouronate transport system permease protein [Clostridiales bacterium]
MINTSKGYKIFQVANVLIMLVVIFVTLYPFIYLAAISFSDESYVYAGQVTFLPKGFTTKTYEVLMQEEDFWTGYKNTIIYTVVGTAICLFMTTILAYPLSKKRLKGRSIILAFIIFTMYFNGGLIPNYLLVRNLGMRNTIWAITIPGAISTYNMIIMRTFFEGLPNELEEAAMIDGMSTYRILVSIILPLSKPIMATMTLFYAVGAWNNWFGPFLYFDKPELFPVTLYLRNMIAGAQQTAVSSGSNTEDLTQIAATVKAATTILTVLPILCIYPFIQKYFVAGVMIGSLKE